MKSGLSIYFDLVRVAAAIVVAFCHIVPVLWPESPISFPGHDAVILFFVLSGYVIAYVCDRPNITIAGYGLDRLSRLWSVQIPAVGIAALAALSVSGIAAARADGALSWTAFGWRAFINSVFLGEGWTMPGDSPFNIAVWSLNYEAWYYIIFAGWVFAPARLRWIAVTCLGLVAGPKILTLMPCWLAGVLLYRYRDRIVMRERTAYLLFFASIALYAPCCLFDTELAARVFLRWVTAGEAYHLGPSTSVLSDYFVSILVSAQFAAVMNMPSLERILGPMKGAIAFAASFTLSIYLFHMPLTTLIVVGMGLGVHGGLGAVLAVALIFAAAIALGSVTEHRRKFVRLWLSHMVPASLSARREVA